ncbi:MAG: DNA-3-methyladenine glycosylase 2 family protein [Acidimicrobiales bacterium]
MHQRAELAVDGPLDLAMTMGLIGMSSRDPSFRVFGRNTVTFATNTPRGTASARFVHRDGVLAVDVWGDGGDHVLARARTLAGLHDRPLDFAPEHRALASLARRYAGLRLTAGADPIEIAMRAVFGQRVTSDEARQSWWRFVHRHGETAPGPLELRAPPRSELVARLGRDALLRVGLDLHRSRALVALSRESDRLRATCDDGELVAARLRTLPGIGPWTIGLVRHLAYGDASAVPLGDWHIGRDLCFALSGEERGNDTRMLELLAPFAGNEGRVWRLISAAGIHHPRRASGRAPNPLLADFVARR